MAGDGNLTVYMDGKGTPPEPQAVGRQTTSWPSFLPLFGAFGCPVVPDNDIMTAVSN
jgi:hypothetical protein